MQEILRAHIEKIVPLTEDEFAFVCAHFTLKHYKKREFLIEKGKSVPDCYFVVSGLLKLVYHDERGKEHIVAFAMEDWWESDFPAFYTRTKATMSLRCLEDTQVFCLSLADYHQLCTGLQKMEHFQEWIARHGIRQALTFFEVKSLFETLTIELEATAAK
jgi:CRP-like cAMP-binding protein